MPGGARGETRGGFPGSRDEAGEIFGVVSLRWGGDAAPRRSHAPDFVRLAVGLRALDEPVGVRGDHGARDHRRGVLRDRGGRGLLRGRRDAGFRRGHRRAALGCDSRVRGALEPALPPSARRDACGGTRGASAARASRGAFSNELGAARRLATRARAACCEGSERASNDECAGQATATSRRGARKRSELPQGARAGVETRRTVKSRTKIAEPTETETVIERFIAGSRIGSPAETPIGRPRGSRAPLRSRSSHIFSHIVSVITRRAPRSSKIRFDPASSSRGASSSRAALSIAPTLAPRPVALRLDSTRVVPLDSLVDLSVLTRLPSLARPPRSSSSPSPPPAPPPPPRKRAAPRPSPSSSSSSPPSPSRPSPRAATSA